MNKIYGIIYKITNKINGKIYIGQTIGSLNERTAQHINDALFSKDNMYFHKAIKKYGKESFIWEIIAECNDMDELNKIEIEMIKKYDTYNSGYNLTIGGGGISGWKHTKESRGKMSESRKGTFVREKSPMYGKHPTEETRQKQSEAHKGLQAGEKHPFYNKKLSAEHIKKLSDSHKEKKPSAKTKQKLSKTQIGNRTSKAKKYIVITPEGKEFFIHGIADFCRNYKEEKLNYSHLIAVAKGKRNHNKRYKCKYYESSID